MSYPSTFASSVSISDCDQPVIHARDFIRLEHVRLPLATQTSSLLWKVSLAYDEVHTIPNIACAVLALLAWHLDSFYNLKFHRIKSLKGEPLIGSRRLRLHDML